MLDNFDVNSLYVYWMLSCFSIPLIGDIRVRLPLLMYCSLEESNLVMPSTVHIYRAVPICCAESKLLVLLYWLCRESFAGTAVLVMKKVMCWYCCTGYVESHLLVLL